MRDIRQLNIKNRTYYFFNDIINIKDFDSNLLKMDRKSCKNIDIYYKGNITIKIIDHYENIHRVNPLYLIIAEAEGYIDKKNGKTYFIFASTRLQIKKRSIDKIQKIWDEINKWQ